MYVVRYFVSFFFFKQKTAYEMRISDWSSDVCSSDLPVSLTTRRPDDWHVHLRDGEMLKAVLPFTAAQFARGIVMPNLVPPVTQVEDARAYRERILAARPRGSDFLPLMTCYLTDNTSPKEIERGFLEGVWVAAKLYPAGATHIGRAACRERVCQ